MTPEGQPALPAVEGQPAPVTDPVPPAAEGVPVAEPPPTVPLVPLKEGEPKSAEPVGTDITGAVPLSSLFTTDELKQSKTLEKFKTPDDLANSYIALEQKQGTAGIKAPGEEGTPEDWNKFYNALGRPETSEGYKVAMPEETELVGHDTELMNAFKPVAHSIGLNDAQLQHIIDWQHGYIVKQAEERKEQYNTTVAAMETEYGAAAPKNMALAGQFIQRFGGDDAIAALQAAGLDNHPAVVKMCVAAGREFLEDALVGDALAGLENRDVAKEKIAAINADLEHAYHDPKKPGHKEAKKEMTRLFELGYN